MSIKMTNGNSPSYASWSPTRPVSRGATAYHDAVAYTSWHKDNMEGLIKLAKNNINDGDIVIDFGAGTGSSALYLMQGIKSHYKLILVDNSPSWLGKAYEILHAHKNIAFLLLEKSANKYQSLYEAINKNTVDHIVSANTVHLIPNIEETFKGIYDALKKRGTFIFQSGNIFKNKRSSDILMIDDSINAVHTTAIEIIRENNAFVAYRKTLDQRIQEQAHQRKFVFPPPRPIEYYVTALQSTGFKHISVAYEQVKVLYKDWLAFLKVKRLQAGILPEIGGKDASSEEEKERDILITKAAFLVFDKLKKQNALANNTSFITEWTYVSAEK